MLLLQLLMVMVRMRYLRVGGLDILPALAEVLPQLGERTEAQLPLQLAGVPLLGRQDLAQRVDLLLHLHNTHRSNLGCNSLLFLLSANLSKKCFNCSQLSSFFSAYFELPFNLFNTCYTVVL